MAQHNGDGGRGPQGGDRFLCLYQKSPPTPAVLGKKQLCLGDAWQYLQTALTTSARDWEAWVKPLAVG